MVYLPVTWQITRQLLVSYLSVSLGTVSKIPWSQWSEIFFTSPLTPLPPPPQKWNSVLLLASFYDGKHKHEANFGGKSEIVTMKSPTPPPSEKYFTSLASRYFWDGPLLWDYGCFGSPVSSSTGYGSRLADICVDVYFFRGNRFHDKASCKGGRGYFNGTRTYIRCYCIAIWYTVSMVTSSFGCFQVMDFRWSLWLCGLSLCLAAVAGQSEY